MATFHLIPSLTIPSPNTGQDFNMWIWGVRGDTRQPVKSSNIVSSKILGAFIAFIFPLVR